MFLKSTDDSMLDTLQKMSGTTHRVFKDSKTVTKDVERIAFATEGKVSYGMSVKEMPTISYNDMAFITERNSIVFRAGDSPIWNRNETILPMSWRLFQNTIIQPGRDYSLQTIPTLSSALDFDVRKNQPDFTKMWQKRKTQAMYAAKAIEAYRDAYGYGDYEIEQLDPDLWADEIMTIINEHVLMQENGGVAVSDDEDEYEDPAAEFDAYMYEADAAFCDYDEEYEENEDVKEETMKAAAQQEDANRPRYAKGELSRNMLMNNGQANHSWDGLFREVYRECRAHFEQDTKYFSYVNGDLVHKASLERLITQVSSRDAKNDADAINEASRKKGSNVHAEEDVQAEHLETQQIEDAFYRFLISLEDWNDLLDGRFEDAVCRVLNKDTE